MVLHSLEFWNPSFSSYYCYLKSFKSYKMYRFVLLIVVIFNSLMAQAQSDTVLMVKYTPDFRFQDGVYLNFEAVKRNTPISPERIHFSTNPSELSFYDKLFEQEKLAYYDEYGTKQEVEMSSVWGYARMGVLFIWYNEETNRIPIVGSACHFVANYTYQTQRNYDPFYSPYRTYDPYAYNYRNQPVTNKEMRQYLLDWESGKVFIYNRESLEVLLMKDPALYEEYNALSRRKQKKMLFFYLRRFNENNPIYLPIRM